MNYRHTEILAATDLGASGTKPIEIKITDPISAITVKHWPVGVTADLVNHPAANLERIEVADGSEVLYGLTGKQGQALNINEAKFPVIQEVDYRAGGVPLVYVHILFGRRLWDPELALLPGKFNNLQMKIKWNRVNFDSGCTSHNTMVYGHVFDEKAITPVGYLMTKDVKNYEPSAGGNEYTKLPNDYPIRKLMIQAAKLGTGFRGIVERIKLDEDTDKRIPIDGDIHDLEAFLQAVSGEAEDAILVYATVAGVNVPCTAWDLFAMTANGQATTNLIYLTGPFGGRFGAMADTGTTLIRAHVKGRRPHGCVCIPFGNQEDLDDWWDVTKVGHPRLTIKGGASAAAGDQVSVITQQLRRY